MDKYDVAVIGAGLGGLICGTYLAKSGLRVCIIEKNAKVGGYCASFVRNNYKFDVGVHYFGGIRKGLLGKILDELDLKDKIQFNQFDPADTVLTSDSKVYLRANHLDTTQEFKKSFPSEKNNIDRFFNFVMQEDFLTIYKKAKKISFEHMLNDFFNNISLKKMIEGLFWAVLAVPASDTPALIAIATFRHFFLDPGYYPNGGMDAFMNIFEKEIKKYNGDIILSKKVTEIIVKSDNEKTLLIEGDSKINAKYIVANIDPFQLLKLLKRQTECLSVENEFAPSLSAMVTYLGLNCDLCEVFKDGSCVWIPLCIKESAFLHSHLAKLFHHEDIAQMLIFSPSFRDGSCCSLNAPTLEVFFPFPYIKDKIKNQEKNDICEFVIKKIEKMFPSLGKHIVTKDIATPEAFYKQTLNTNGAILGKKISTKMNSNISFPQNLFASGLFFTGAWYGYGGTSEVAISGKRTAGAMLQVMKKKSIGGLIKL